ncbi:hypothetical protein [Streptomyces sp. NPDC053367]|uniref:hypothetical protein n=1 Tax=Streptomyces sp. NPDC053367 TaxID=3365700 RepID=UPI0037CFF866
MAEHKAPQGTDRLRQELEKYIEARIQSALAGMGQRLGSSARRLSEKPLGPRALAGDVAQRGRALRGRLPSGATVTSRAAAQAKDTAAHAKETVLQRAKGLIIIEDIDVGVPVPDAYDGWRRFQESGQSATGIQRGEGAVTEEVPRERIAWTSEVDHAVAKGVVTFHPLGESLTKVLLVLRYIPKGPVERAETLLRVQSRRARRDLKRYRTFVMMRDDEDREEHEDQDEREDHQGQEGHEDGTNQERDDPHDDS